MSSIFHGSVVFSLDESSKLSPLIVRPINNILCRPSADHWRQACYWLAATLIGGLLPLYGTYFILCVKIRRANNV